MSTSAGVQGGAVAEEEAGVVEGVTCRTEVGIVLAGVWGLFADQATLFCTRYALHKADQIISRYGAGHSLIRARSIWELRLCKGRKKKYGHGKNSEVSHHGVEWDCT